MGTTEKLAETRALDALPGVLGAARIEAMRTRCGHGLVCANKECREADHDHESYGEDGWSCGEECPCIPACAGLEPEVCEKVARAQAIIDAIDELTSALAEGRS